MTEQTKTTLKTYFVTGAFPTETQFGDLIDTFVTETSSLAQAPSPTIISNITGVSATPVNNTMTAILDAVVTAARGSLLFRGAASWQPLSPGTSGQLLQTGGAGADVSWLTASGTGTVTSVSAGGGLTASTNPITATGDISLAQIPAKRLMANTTGVSAAPVSNTLTAMIDAEVSGAQGGILYRNATSWVALAPGTNGQVLTTAGVSANPSWTAAGGGVTAVYKTADEVRGAIQVSADSSLLFSVLANTKYRFSMKLFYDTAAGNSDLKWTFTGPAAPTLVRIMGAGIEPLGTGWLDAIVNTAFSTTNQESTASTGAGYLEVNGILQNGANAGTVQFAWGPVGAANLTIRAGTYIEYATVQ